MADDADVIMQDGRPVVAPFSTGNTPAKERWPSLNEGRPTGGILQNAGYFDADKRRWGVGVDASGRWCRFRVYVYTSPTDCTMRGPHEARPRTWPIPGRRIAKTDQGAASLIVETPGDESVPCELCGVWLVVTNEMEGREEQTGVKILIAETKKARA